MSSLLPRAVEPRNCSTGTDPGETDRQVLTDAHPYPRAATAPDRRELPGADCGPATVALDALGPRPPGHGQYCRNRHSETRDSAAGLNGRGHELRRLDTSAEVANCSSRMTNCGRSRTLPRASPRPAIKYARVSGRRTGRPLRRAVQRRGTVLRPGGGPAERSRALAGTHILGRGPLERTLGLPCVASEEARTQMPGTDFEERSPSEESLSARVRSRLSARPAQALTARWRPVRAGRGGVHVAGAPHAGGRDAPWRPPPGCLEGQRAGWTTIDRAA